MKNNLPNNIAIFPLSNAVFFPRTVLPLNIFEDRYIQLINDCMKENRMFGMVQPKTKFGKFPEVYRIGCLGKIISFNETLDKRFIISLSGITRFRIKEELNNDKLYRKFKVDYSEFVDDLDEQKSALINYDKNYLLNKIKTFLEKINYSINHKELSKLNLDQLINTLCMIAPFSVEEKQKLIETVEIKSKAKVLDEIIKFNSFGYNENNTVQ